MKRLILIIGSSGWVIGGWPLFRSVTYGAEGDQQLIFKLANPKDLGLEKKRP